MSPFDLLANGQVHLVAVRDRLLVRMYFVVSHILVGVGAAVIRLRRRWIRICALLVVIFAGTYFTFAWMQFDGILGTLLR